ncbi:MAG: MmgE/PrpD family protein [Chloroflexi bacterium]|nr:MmgE/PrpD family protein [Chloroflexota bacterium]
MTQRHSSDGSIIGQLSDYIVKARSAELPEEVALKGKHHVLDTMAAMVSGVTLPPGELAVKYAELQGGRAEAMVVASPVMTNAVTASLCNAIMAHADETDDSHAPSGTHPGCAIVPPAFAMAEKNNRSGADLLRGVVAGYDVGTRAMRALRRPGQAFGGSAGRNFSSHSVGGVFGAAVAAGAAVEFTPVQVRYLLSYAAQQASGITSWQTDLEHIEKAFDFAGMPARSGATAATMVEAGFTGVWDVFEGFNNFFDSFAKDEAQRQELVTELGTRYEVMLTNIKKYCVGSPIQAPVDCLVNIMREHRVGPRDLAHLVVYSSTGENRLTGAEQTMPDINLRYCLAATLIDGDLSFAAGHDVERMTRPDILAITRKIEVRADPSLVTPESPRQGRVEFTTTGGRTYSNHVVKVRGAMENPMTTEEVVKKSRELLAMGVGGRKADQAINALLNLESVKSVRELRPMLQP